PTMRLARSSTVEDGDEPEARRRLMEPRRYAADDRKRRFEPVPGVAAVKVGGGLEGEFQGDIDQRKLAQLGLSLGDVVQRLRQENVNLSGGRLESGARRSLVRTVIPFARGEPSRDMLRPTAGRSALPQATGAPRQLMLAILGSRDPNVIAALRNDGSGGGGAAPVRLRDVAEVRQGHREREAVIRSGGNEAVELAIYKEGDANTVAT